MLTLLISCGDEGGSGNNVGQPEITGVSPDSGFVGDVVAITADGLVPQIDENIVRFNGTRAQITSVSPGQLMTTVPSGATSGTISLEVVGTTTYGPFFKLLTPTATITSVVPTSGRPGDRVTITGTNFVAQAPVAGVDTSQSAPPTLGARQQYPTPPVTSDIPDTTTTRLQEIGDIIVTVGGIAAPVISASPTQIIIEIPAKAIDGAIVISIDGQRVDSQDFNITFDVITPEITGIAPTSGMPGDAVTISGDNFDLDDAVGVSFNGTEATVTGSSATEITTTVPDGATTGRIAVTIGEQTATGPAFTVRENQAPSITSNAEFETAENATSVGTVTASDPDGDELSFSLSGGDDQDAFTINETSGELAFSAAPDFENPGDTNTDNDYKVQVQASDGTQTATQNITVTVTNVYENGAPSITSDASFEIPENTTGVGTITANDPNKDDLTFSISGGADEDQFTIDGTTGELAFSTAPDFENPADANADNDYSVSVQVTDGNETASQAITVTVTDVDENQAPAITSDASFEVEENMTGVGTITATDPDGDDLAFTISGGDDAGQFAIDAGSGALKFSAAPDFENPGDADTDNVYNVSVQVSDGTETASQDVTVTVTDVDENQAPAITSEASFEVPENTTAAGTITATDPNSDELTFSISGGDDASSFTIDGSTGELAFSAAPDFENPGDANTDNAYLLQVQASDGSQSATQNITVSVTDVDENQAPAITSGAEITATEGQKVATTITATDPNGDELTFSLSGGTDQDDFSIDATTGVLSFLVAPNFARPTDSDSDNIYNVSVQVSDNNLTAIQDLTITVPFPFTGGDGTAGNPYQVENLSQLQHVGDFLSDNFVQTANIDASATANSSYGDGKGFAPMGNNLTSFTGTYNGGGFTISGLTINRPSTRLIGIFGLVGSTGNIEDVGVIDANITGGNETGGLAGFNSGSITDSYATGSVTGGSNTAGLVGRNSGGKIKRSYATATIVGSANAGGLVGTNGESGTIADAYATGSVTGGDFNTGGLVGANTSSISHSYATGAVISSGRFIGGLVGAIGGTSTSTDSYWDTQTTGQATSNGGTGLTTAEMVGNTAQTTNMTGFDFSGVWKTNATYYPTLQDNPQANLPVITPNQPPSITSGVSFTATEGQTAVTTITANDPENNTLTYSISGGLDADDFGIAGSSGALAFLRAPDYDNPTDSNTDNAYEVEVSVSDGSASDTKTLSIIVPPFAGGNGTSSTPYQVATLTQLQRVGQVVLSNFVQTQDIDASPTSNASYGDGNGFAPIGDGSNKFRGSYNGDGFTISGLTINRPSTNYVGLFGYTDSGASLTDVALTGAAITGSTNTGGLTGANQGSITGSYATGSVTVTGSDINIGGLAGSNSGSITGSYATADVSINDFSGTANAGGLVGINTNTIENSYATGSVTGAFNCGGLVGTNQGSITNAYATGSVTGGPEIGGLVSQGTGGTITDSYWDTETTGLPGSSGDPGLNTAQMIGSAAQTNMTGFDFSGTWTTNASFYPTLRTNPQANLPVITPNQPPSITSGSSFTATEGQTAVTTVTATDPDMDALTFSITSGDDGGEFTIDPSTGAVAFRTAPDPDNPTDLNTNNEYIVTVQVSDGSAIATQSLIITVPFFAGGDGTAGNPFQVANLGQLQRVGDNLGAHFEQIANVDASTTKNSSYGDGNGFSPIGNGSAFFTGSYDGAGFTISGLTINRPNTTFVGLFGVISSGPGVKDVQLTGVDITGKNNTGALAGANAGTISGSSAGGSVRSTEANGNTGGLVGNNTGSGNISRSSSSSTVSGSSKTGGLAGYNEASGTITTSYATGNVTGNSDETGGLVGENEGTINDTYATGDVTGGDDPGGLVGVNGNTIRRSYAAGAVSGGIHPGGLVGSDDFTDDSYWDIESTGQSSSSGGTGLLTSQMIGSAAQSNMTGFDFSGVWTTNASFYPTLRDNPQSNLPVITPNRAPSITSGTSFTATEGETAVTTITASDPDGDDLTFFNIGGADQGLFTIDNSSGALAFRTAPDPDNPADSDTDNEYEVQVQVSDGSQTDTQTLTITVPFFAGGDGTAGSPYQVSSLAQLQRVGDNLGSNFEQTANIDASATSGWNGGNGFAPIGNNSILFTGSYNGGGFTISGLSIDRGSTSYVGLFGATGSGSTLENVALVGTDITGDNYIGGLAGNNNGTITGSYASGDVTGSVQIGGLVGDNSGSISISYSTVTVGGDEGVGGIAGNNSGSISTSYATGDVNGNISIGGLVGGNNGSITDSYATGSVDGTDRIGGLVGIFVGNITDSYATGSVNGTSNTGGLIGLNFFNDPINTGYWDTQTSGQSASDGGTGLTTAHMQAAAETNMTGFDFSNVWQTQAAGYPILRGVGGQ